MVCRLDGAVEVSDSEMLSNVPSLRKLDFLWRVEPPDWCGLPPPLLRLS